MPWPGYPLFDYLATKVGIDLASLRPGNRPNKTPSAIPSLRAKR